MGRSFHQLFFFFLRALEEAFEGEEAPACEAPLVGMFTSLQCSCVKSVSVYALRYPGFDPGPFCGQWEKL